MASPAFTPPRPPHLGTSRQVDQTVLNADFGDGYEQVTADGLNSFRDSVTMVWNALTVDEADQVETFWRSVGKATAFWFTPADKEAPSKWRFTDKLQRDDIDGGLQRVSATVRQAYDPGD
jgi:phage-related protein